MENDPFALLTLPPPTSSQKQLFETCGFAHEDLPENQEPQLNEAPVKQSTAIVAASLPGDMNDDNPPHEFQTASENSQHGNSEVLGPVIPIVDLTRCDESSKRRRIVIDVDVEMENEGGDLGKGRLNVPVRVPAESVCENVAMNFGITRELPSSMTTNEKDAGDGRVLNNGTGSEEKDKSVGVPTETVCENATMNDDRVLNDGTRGEDKDKSVGVPTKTACENVPVNVRVRGELPASMTTKEKDVGDGRVLNNGTGSEEKDKCVGVPTQTVCENATMNNNRILNDGTRGEVKDKSVGVPTETCENVTVNIGVRRELPASMTTKDKDVGNDGILKDKSLGGLMDNNVLNDLIKTKDKNVQGGREDVSSSSPVNKVFNDIFLVLKRIVTDGDYGVEDSDEDFLEIAKRRGMNFPQPRWWPPEGFSDDDD